MLSLKWLEIVIMSGGMIIFMTIISLSFTLLILLISVIFRIIGGTRIYPTVAMIINYLALLWTSYIFSRTFKIWIDSFHYERTLTAPLLAIILWLLLLYMSRGRIHIKFARMLQIIRRPLTALLIISVCLTVWQMLNTVGKRNELLKKQTPLAVSEQTIAKSNIILITFDALSAEDMSLYGYPLNTTPNIDEFAKNCYVFNNAIAASNWTKPAVASLLTGRYPNSHLLNNINYANNSVYRPEWSLPAILQSNGYNNFAIVANVGNASTYGNGLSPYFSYNQFRYINSENLLRSLTDRFVWKAFQIDAALGIKSALWLANIYYEFNTKLQKFIRTSSKPWYPPSLVFNDAEQLIAKHFEDNRKVPLFLWAHIMPPHYPYQPERGFSGRFLPGSEFTSYDSLKMYKDGQYFTAKQQDSINKLRLRYNENILYADDAFGQYIKKIKSLGLLESSIVIISSDHGESFNHGYYGHGGLSLYQPSVHIPLLIHLPKQRTSVHINSNVSQTDIAPTVLELAEIPKPDWFDGISLKHYFQNTYLNANPVFTMNLEGNSIKGKIRKGSAAVVIGDFKYILNLNKNNGELFNTKNDPSELVNLVNLNPDITLNLKRTLLKKLGLTSELTD